MLWTITALIASAVLAVIAYPQVGWWLTAWAALVPYLWAIDGKSTRAAFGWSFLFGFMFFAGTLGWFVHVTVPGAILLLLYLSFYIALFGVAFRYFSACPLVWRIFILPAVWVVLEFIRAHLFTGFGWAMLGHSQYKNIWLIQIADVTGVYGVSYLVMLVNVLLFERTKLARAPQTSRPAKLMLLLRGIVCMVVAAALLYGWNVINAADRLVLPTVKVGVVQPNISQSVKWDPTAQPWIVQKTINLTHDFDKSELDLIVWPETSLPGVISEAPYMMEAIKITARKMNKPLLIGAISDDRKKYYNSAYFVKPDGTEGLRYDKIHLVPFGEFFPFRPILGWIYTYIGFDDFTPGKKYTLFKAGEDEQLFGVLICFEDTLGYLWRNFTNAGAGFLINMTNDAWFMDTKAPFIHLQAAVFGAVENKRSLVRAANTGFSGFVDPWGRILGQVKDEHNKMTFVPGTASASIPVMTTKTFYTKFGDIFTWLCFFAILLAIRTRKAK